MSAAPNAASPFMFAPDFAKFADFSKFSEMTRMMSDYRMPVLDIETLMTTHRRNVEAMTTAGQLTMEGWQQVLKHQAEMVRQNVEHLSTLASNLMSEATPEAKATKQAELIRAGMEKVAADLKELAELVQKSNHEAAEILTRRVTESMAEMKTALEKARAAA